MYLVEARRESWLIEYLDANPAERCVSPAIACARLLLPFCNRVCHSRDALDKVLKSNKYNTVKVSLTPPSDPDLSVHLTC